MRILRNNKFGHTKETTFRVDQPDTLFPFLERKFGSMSRSGIKKLLSNNLITVDNQPVTQFDFPLTVGQSVVITKASDNNRFRNPLVKIVYQNDDLFVIEKREGLLSNSTNPKDDSVQRILNTYLDKTHQRCSSHVVHRLDRDTSGLMIFAKSKKIALAFEENWKEMVYDRRYTALVCGEMQEKTGTIRSHLRENSKFEMISSPTDNGGKLAITHYHVLAVGNGFSLVELTLETGRKNQIRVHLRDLGFPVDGDIKYGNGTCSFGRLALHASKLCFYDPKTHEKLEFESSEPKNWRKKLEL